MALRNIAIAVLVVSIVVVVATLFTTQKPTDDTSETVFSDASELRELRAYWVNVLREKESEKAYEMFLASVPQHDANPHDQAHMFGEALYEVEGISGLAVCDSSYEFGCYHSFLSLAVYEHGTSVLPELGAACEDAYQHDYDILPCQHGVGHGILYYVGEDSLVEALKLCDQVTVAPMGGCTSGVFMEYNFRTIASNNGTSGYVRPVSDNVYEPCVSLPSRFQLACYFEQVQWWQAVFHNDFTHIGTLCQKVEKTNSANQTACYQSIGNYAVAQEKTNYQNIIDTCNSMPTETGVIHCIQGAIGLLTGDEENQIVVSLCKKIPQDSLPQCSG